MKRAVSLVMLLVLALPYAHTPICMGSGHEHEGHHPMTASFEAAGDHSPDSSDCHRLMACDRILQAVTASPQPALDVAPPLLARDVRSAAGQDDPIRVPIPPPPQPV